MSQPEQHPDSQEQPTPRLQILVAWLVVAIAALAASIGVFIALYDSGNGVMLGSLAASVICGYALIRFAGKFRKRGRGRRRFSKGRTAGALAIVLMAFLSCTFLAQCPLFSTALRQTAYPAGIAPDQIVLTWSGDPKTTQSVQWRTVSSVEDGVVRYRPMGSSDPWSEASSHSALLEDLYLTNDREVMRHTAVIQGLEPGREYAYQVGSGGQWSSEAAFKTAPSGADSFSFIYMGDAQRGLLSWGELLHTAYDRHPEAAFYMMAGDLVNNGVERNEWDGFFHVAKGVYDHRPVVPCIGNHEKNDALTPWMYLALFDLPRNGPEGATGERSYSFTYANAEFIILDSNRSASAQREWLEQCLSTSTAAWKFVMFHHPAYSSKPGRDNGSVRSNWCPLFEAYGVTMALQGHDHAYMRTYPLRDGQPVQDPADGTTYVVSNAGSKHYDQELSDLAAVGFVDVPTYQLFDIQDLTLTYRAYDAVGTLHDELVIHK